jgi:hypothetical protein
MEIATLLNAHGDTNLIIDTLASIFAHVGRNVLVLVDGVAWDDLRDVELPARKVCGFKHGVPKAPYRNVALGLSLLVETWPDADWYCYTEYDVLFTSPRFRYNLKMADERDVWMLGNCGRVDEVALSFVEAMVGEEFNSVYYMLGCCQFFSKNFMGKLLEIDFFDRFLSVTNGFSGGHFPGYSGYDISEHLYPTLCRHFGGNVGVFATWDDVRRKWHGAYRHFPMRWKPELDPVDENYQEASIIHPLKTYDHPLREYHRNRRKQWSLTSYQTASS